MRSTGGSDPDDCPPHESVTILPTTLVKLTLTQSLAGEDLTRAAKKLGTTPIGLRAARIAQTIHTTYARVRRGRPMPMLYTPADAFGIRAELDPNARRFAPPDPAWGWTATFLHCHLPRDFKQQQLTRVAVYFDRTQRYADKSNLHPEHPLVDPPLRKPGKLLPPPPPDFVQYKWKGDVYVGYDWKAAEKNPRIRINYEKHQRKLALSRAARKRRRQLKGAGRRTGTGSLEFKGWLWICPHYSRTCRTIYLPAGPINLLERLQPRLAERVDIPRPALCKTFACRHCHNIRNISRLNRSAWNALIAYLSAGLLYGHEVPRPDWFIPQRKLAFAPRPNRAPSKRRAQVCELLLQGLTHAQIGQRLGLSRHGVGNHVTAIHRIERVHSLKELAHKLGRPNPSKREQIRRALNTGLTYRQAAAQLGYSYDSVRKHGANIRREQRMTKAAITV